MSSYSSYAIVTGASSGIGLDCAKALAAAQPSTLVVVASRTAPADLPANTEFHALDLASLESVAAFVAWWPYGPVASLTCCAGVMLWQVAFTPAGLEETFAVNHVGHAALLFGLAQRGLILPAARITFVSSTLHKPDNRSGARPAWTTADEVAHAATAEQRVARTAYCNSKLANVGFANALAKRVAAAGGQWSVNTYDPGFVPGSGLSRSSPLPFRLLSNYLLPYLTWLFERAGIRTSTSQHSGTALAEMAYADKYAGVRGAFVHIDKEDQASAQSHDPAFQDDLWDWTVHYLHVEPDLVAKL